MYIRPLMAAGTLIGIGMGGFVDGILFHQILQVHNMISGKLPTDTLTNMEINMMWDGLFHALTWVMTASGISLLWKAGEKGANTLSWDRHVFIGSLLIGWGLFNVIEGVIDHHLFQVHHVVEKFGLSIYDYAFLISGIILIISGMFLINRSKKNITNKTL